MYYSADDTGRILATTTEEYVTEDMGEFDFPESFDFLKQSEYRIQDGELIHDPLPPSDEEQAAQAEAERREQMNRAAVLFVQTQSASLTDAQALTVPLLFDEWAPGREYSAKTVLRHSGALYRVAQDHTSQTQWEPGGAEALYTPITIDPETGIEVWKQPTGAHDAYNTGDRVLYPDESGDVYESLIDGNTWSPDAYPQGWAKVE